MAAPEFSVENLKEMTQILSSDDYEGRAPMTAGEEKTIAFLSERMAAAGLQPGGENGGWYQKVPLVEVSVDPASADLIFSRNGREIANGAYGEDQVVWSRRWQPDVDLKDAELVFVGYGIDAQEKQWDDYAIDMTGKVAVILVNDPDWKMDGLDGDFGGRAMTYYGRWTYKFEEAAAQGAVGALIIHDSEAAGYGWPTVESSWSGPQIYLDGQNQLKNRLAAEGWLHTDFAETLFEASGQNLSDLRDAAGQRNFSPVPLGTTMSMTLRNNSIRRQQSNNVVGILPGTERPDEFVLYTAHWDHLGRCGADETGDDICNGAFDNATGTAGLVELGRVHAEAGATERSLVFLAVTAEESGLLGSAYYAEQPLYPLARTVGGVNMDGLGILGETNDVVVIGGGKSELEDILAIEAAAQDRRIDLEPSPEKGSFYRSDHFSLAKKGVPMLYAEGGIDIVGKGPEFGRQAADDYIAARYHQPSDEYDPDWNWSGAVQDLEMYYAIGRTLAQSEEWPNWRAGDEFRAIRDESRAGVAGE